MDWLSKINTVFTSFSYLDSLSFKKQRLIKIQDLKGSMCQTSLQIYWASVELCTLNIFLTVSLLISVYHSPLKLASEMRPWVKGWKERIHQLNFVLSLTFLCLLHYYSVSAQDQRSKYFVGQRKLKQLK